MIDKLRSIFWGSHHGPRSDRKFEWMLTSFVWLCGLRLLYPDDLFYAPSVTAYDYVREIMPQQGWGIVAMILANIRAIALFINGAGEPLSPWVRSMLSWLCIFFWTLISLLIISAATTFPFYALWTINLAFWECAALYYGWLDYKRSQRTAARLARA